MIKVAINGFGRIGRSAFKIAFDGFADSVEIVAINDLADDKTLTHLLKYDSNYGRWHRQLSVEGDEIIIEGKRVKVLCQEDPKLLPWDAMGVDVVIESTGAFTDIEGAGKHLLAGAKRVVISAPSSGDNPAPTYVLGVNRYDGQAEIINNASCTTNSLAPMLEVLNDEFGVEKSLMTTIHGYTQDQMLQDGPHKDLRRARAAAENIVPTTTGAAHSTIEVIPGLKGKFDGVAIRVPVKVGSLSDVTALLYHEVSVDDINNTYIAASKSDRYKGILEVTHDPIVSSDIIGSSASVTIDLGLTKVVGNLVKVCGWYDNEWGYSHRLIEQVVEVGKACNKS